MNEMNQITIPLEELFKSEVSTDPQNTDLMAIGIEVARRYHFLPQPLFIHAEGDRVILQFPDAPKANKAEAARLAERAAKHARNSNHQRAIAIWRRVLELIPSDLVARRDLGMVYSELGDVAKARQSLAEALLIDAEDSGSLVALANLEIRQKDYATAEKYARKAVAVEPQNAWAKNCLGAVLFYTGRYDQALSVLQDTIKADPQIATPYGTAAYIHLQQGRLELADQTLRDLFACTKKQDIRCDPIFAQARRLFGTVQQGLVEKHRAEQCQAVDALFHSVEQQTGWPIRVMEEKSDYAPVGRVEFAWQHQRDHHRILCSSSYPQRFQPHLLAHEGMHIRLGHEALQAGRSRIFNITEAHQSAVLGAFESRLHRLQRKGYELEPLVDYIGLLLGSLFNALWNVPLDIAVETRILQEMPVLASQQFLALTTLKESQWTGFETQQLSRLMPARYLRALVGLYGVHALFIDSLCPGASECAAKYRNGDGFDLAQKLWRHWQTKAKALQPGDEYDLVDEFADILGLRGSYDWRPDRPTCLDTALSIQE
jgi:Flp pilus assembly protein TadD